MSLTISLTSPFNLSPAIQTVVSAVKQARQSQPSQKIAVLMGEEHRTCSHILLQSGVLQQCKDIGLNPAYARELPHNTALTIAKKVTDFSFSHCDFEMLTSHAGKSDIFHKGYIGFSRSQSAPITNLAVSLFCHQQGLRYVFTDAARHLSWLDIQDPITYQFAKPKTKADKIDTRDREGMAIRNAIMLNNTNRLCADHSLVVHGMGISHVFGNVSQYGYAHSTSTLFKQNGWHVVEVIAERPEKTRIPSIPTQADTNSLIVIEGMNADHFDNSFLTDEGTEADMFNRIKGETGHALRHIHIATPLTIQAMKNDFIGFLNQTAPMIKPPPRKRFFEALTFR